MKKKHKVKYTEFKFSMLDFLSELLSIDDSEVNSIPLGVGVCTAGSKKSISGKPK